LRKRKEPKSVEVVPKEGTGLTDPTKGGHQSDR
jgi:hypothetical protein